MLSSFQYALALALTLVTGSIASAAPPTLTHLFPAGGQRGAKVVVACTGSFSWPVKAWAPGLDIVPAKEAGKLEVTIPKDLAADRVWIRLYNAEGASAPAPFHIDNLKEIAEKEPNDEPRSAEPMADANVIVNGILQKAADVDCFAVRLTAGQTLFTRVDAHDRLGSPMDPIVQVTTPDGIVLAENNDDVHLDPRLVFTPTKPGTYVVRVFAFSSTPNTSISLSGGANYVYRLTLTTGPIITHAVPLSAPLANPGSVEVHGWNVPPKSVLTIVPFGSAKDAEHFEREVLDPLRLPGDARLGFVFAPNFAGAARVRLTSHAVASALAIDPKKPMTLQPASSVTGWLRAARQVDTFRVPLKKGQGIVVSAESNSLGFPFDSAVKLAGPDGTMVASSADLGPNREAMFAYAAVKDGDHQLSVSDRFRQGGQRSFYRLTVRLDEPDFDLSAATDAIVITPGKTTDLPIKVQRRGAVGPITFHVLGLPTGVTAAPLSADPAATTATLKLTTSGAAYSGPIRIVGKVTTPQPLERYIRTPPRLGATFESLWLTVEGKK